MTKQRIKREEIASCPICQEQIAFKIDLQLDVPDDVSVLGASLQIPLVHKECALKERERSFETAVAQRRGQQRQDKSQYHL